MSFTTFFRKYFGWLFIAFIYIVSWINWKNCRPLTTADLTKLQQLLTSDYYLICTHSRNHLSTYMIGLGDFMLTHKMGFYSHCLMNLEDTVNSVNDFKLVEATLYRGTSVDSFATVFRDVDAVALLKPKSMELSVWTEILDKAKSDVGKKYDTLYDFTQDKKLSCIELIRDCLRVDPNYATNFANFEALIAKYGEITPQMLRDCPDFEVVFEVKVP